MIAAFATAALLAGAPDLAPSDALKAAVARNRGSESGLIAALEPLAASGDASAAQALGELFSGKGGVRDMARACGYFERGAAKRADSAHNLATCHFRGEGRPQDLVRARTLYERASREGLSRADCALGNMLIAGLGGPAEPAHGLELCRRAAEAGDADAQADLGGHLLAGTAGAKDSATARLWLTRAAERGHANAALLLGKVHWNGDGTPKSNSEAARWWRLAHERGNSNAAFLLGREAFVRLVGSGATPAKADPTILEEAIRWLKTAAQGDTDPQARAQAKALLDQLRPLEGRLGRK